MDERHWWFASKLQETFHFGGYDNPTVLEDFLSDPEVVDLINDLLAPGEPCKLFFYCDEPAGHGSRRGSASGRLHATSELTNDVVSRGRVCLYVLRAETDGEVEVAQMEKELFCGELRHSVLSSLASLLSEAYTPLLHSQKNWGECSDVAVTNFLQNFDKFSSALLETASLSQTLRPLLQRPSPELAAELQNLHGRGAVNVDVMGECEALVGEWVGSIEGILLEATDERMEDPQSSPLSELSKWRQRHCLLASVVEQLKVKETRLLFTVLVAMKSRVLKKWKNIDSQLTDAFNNARDRVRYLESLSPHLEALEASPSLPSTLSTLLPSITTAVRHMEGLSRAYARSGYLGILFTKISNALVRICVASLRNYCRDPLDDRDTFWDILFKSVQAQIESGLSQPENPFLTQLTLCLQVATVFKEMLHHLKEVLITQHHFSTPSHSLGHSTISLSGAKKGSATPTNPLGGGNKRPGVGGLAVPGTEKKNLAASAFASPAGATGSGVALHDVDQIAAGMNDLSSRVTQVMEVVATLSQFRTLVGNLRGLPRVAGLWPTESKPADQGSLEDTNERDTPIEGSVRASEYLEQVFGQKNDYPLPPLKEEEEEEMGEDKTPEDDSTAPAQTSQTPPPSSSSSSSVHSSPNDSIALHVHSSLGHISTSLSTSCQHGVSEVFSIGGRSRFLFPSAYDIYTSQVTALEKDICSYLATVVPKVASSKEALDIIARFSGVSGRATMRETSHTCCVTAFGKYSTELEEIRACYERNKGHPPISHSLPPIAGAISWCREMLQRVTEPMETFKGHEAVMQSVSSLEVCKLHNRLSASLLQHEALLIARWHGAIESARTGLGLPLLVQDGSRREDGPLLIGVNCQKSLLDVMSESKALSMIGVPLPEVARSILAQEVRVKQFRLSLQQVLDEFHHTLTSLDPPLQSLLVSHTDAVIRSLLPGCSSLTWNTLNIDAFLHHAGSTVSAFQTTARRIQSILRDHVYSTLHDIAKSTLYDLELASSRTWTPSGFSDAMKSSILRNAASLVSRVSRLRRAVLTAIAIARGRETGEIADLKGDLLLARLTGEGRGGSKVTSQSSFHGSKLQSLQSTRVTTTNSSRGGGKGERGREEEGAEGEGEMDGVGEEALSYICGLVFNAVCEAVARSHCQMYAGLRAGPGGGDRKGRESGGADSPSVDQMSRSCVDLSGQKTVRFRDPQTVDNPRAVLADMSLKFYSHSSIPPLRLEARIQLSIPRIHMEPRLSDIHMQFVQVTSALLSVLRNLSWWAGPGAGREFHVMWDASGAVDHMHTEILQSCRSLESGVDHCLSSLRVHDFIWREDMHITYQHFLQGNPSQAKCCEHVERFMDVEKTLSAIPAVSEVGPLQMSTQPVTDALNALALAWKLEFASFLHNQAQTSLTTLVEHRQSMTLTLQQPVETLAQLRACLQLLLDISDLQNSIDDHYVPIERMYELLKLYTPSLPRSEVNQVDSLREEWEALTQLADSTQHRLLYEHRHIHERETEKQVRAFQVETIRFRNSFDTEGPLVPGLSPQSAMNRLDSFQRQCDVLQSRQELLCAVQSLLSLPVTGYTELDQTHTDMIHLQLLYFNYRNFLAFDERFRQTLWQEVDLSEAGERLDALWSNTASLPTDQQEWEATRQLRIDVCHYRDLIPLLTRLHAKEVRNRHWLQVMRVTNCTFQLEGSVFRLTHLLEARLLLYEEEIERIVTCAQKELELETEFRTIEENWNEQVLQFTSHKDLGAGLLDVDHTHSLCEGLESVGVRLAAMLVSRHVAPLREEVVQWAGRLSRVNDVLTQWLCVQEQWRQLEAVLTVPDTARAFRDEAVQFSQTTSSWLELMAAAAETPGVMQCCDGEVSRVQALDSLRERLERCKKSLTLYLLSKRQAFPRFFYVSDDSLLQILSSPLSPSSLTRHLPTLFTNTRSLVTCRPNNKGEDPVIITAVESVEGERLNLTDPVTLCSGVEIWASRLLASSRRSLAALLRGCLSSHGGSSPPSVVEMVKGQICQVAGLALHLQWTRDTELALTQCRYDRRALPGLRSKFTCAVLGKLTHMLMRGRRRTGDEAGDRERQKVEALAMLAVWLRDIIDDLCHQKIRGVADFEWQRFLRPCISEPQESDMLQFQCLHVKLEYGYEYLGCHALPVLTPRMNNCMIALTQGMESGLHNMVCGPQDSSKQEMIKGIAHLLGRYLLILPCTSLTSCYTLVRIMEGLAQDGGWGCFTDVAALSAGVLSVMSHVMEAVNTALHSKQAVCQMACGRTATIQPGMAVFLTSCDQSWELPPGMAPLFRTFSLPPLDPSLCLLAYCTALGLRAPRQLASKLTTLHQMTATQLRSGLPLQAVCHVLRETRHGSSRIRAGASSPQHKCEGGKSDATVVGGRAVGEHGSHRHLTSRSPVKETHHSQKTISLVTTPPSSQPLPASAAREHIALAQLLATLLGPQYDDQEYPVFLGIVRSVFALDHSVSLSPHLEMDGASQPQATPTADDVVSETMESILARESKKAGLVTMDSWLVKVKEILAIVQLTNRHLVLAGRAATGKTAALNIAASALNSQPNRGSKVNIHRVFPGAFDDLSTLIGRFSASGGWEEGVCSTLLRKALQAPLSDSWVCLDGEPSHTWLHPLAELLSGSHTLCLPNGERLETGGSGLRLVFETGDLHASSPATLNSCGVVFFGSSVLSWQLLVEAWLRSRRSVERSCLREQFLILMDPVMQLVCRDTSHGDACSYSEVGLTETCLAYLTSLLNTYVETAESFSKIHVVRLLVFSIVWSFGAVLAPGADRQRFGRLIKSLTNSLPDDDSHYCVFDYYVDESGEWDVWKTRLPAPPPTKDAVSGHVDLLGSVYVDTPDSVRVEVLLDLALSAGRSVLMVGPHGCGKTTVCRHFLQGRVLSHMISEGACHLALDGHTPSSSLHQFMEVYMHHRQGLTYGPQDRKTLHVFIDDLHLPLHNKTTPPSCHEYIRQLIDGRGVYNLGKPNAWSTVEDLTIFAALTSSSGKTTISPRLQRHFAVIHLPELSEPHLAAIMSETLHTLCGGLEGSEIVPGDGVRITGEALSSVVQSTVAVFQQVREALRESEMAGRRHYTFSLSHIESVFQGLYQCLSSTSFPGLPYCWSHEMSRCLSDHLCHSLDQQWLFSLIHSHAEKLPGGLPSNPPITLSSVPVEIKQGEEQPSFTTTPINQLPEVELHPLADCADMDLSLSLFLMRCRQDWGDFPLDLSPNHIRCILRLHRALKFPRGNSILVGPHGQQLPSIARFSLYLAGYQLRQLDCSSRQTFHSSLRSMFRRAGLEGKPVAAILTEADLGRVEVLQILNSLCATGELSVLFSNDEMDGILQALAPSIKKDFPSEETHPMHYLMARITRHLRIVLCLTPASPLLEEQAQSFRGLLSGCHIVWMDGWTEEQLSHSLSHFFSTNPLASSLTQSLRTRVFNCLTAIHRLILKQSGHLKLAGQPPSPLLPHFPPPSTTHSEDSGATDSNSPTSIRFLLENVLQIDRDLGGHNSSTGFAGEFKLPYVGPLTFRRFLESFCAVYSRKSSEVKVEKQHLEQALQALEGAAQEVSDMKSNLSSLQKDYSAACGECDSLLQTLTDKSCQVERMKAVMGAGSSVMNAIQMTAEQERAMAEDYEDDDELLAALVGEVLGRRGSRLEIQLEKAREMKSLAETEEREAMTVLLAVKEQVQHFESGIDRNCIDQIKSLPSPPALVCTVMQVILKLLQQHGRDVGGASGKVGVGLSKENFHSGTSGSQHSESHHHAPASHRKTSIQTETTDAKGQWQAIKLAIGDSQKFRDLILGLHWKEGLTIEAVNLIKSHLATTPTGRQKPRESDSNSAHSQTQQTLVTLTAAKHAAEVVEVMCGFAVAMVDYTAVYKTHRLAANELRRASQHVSELEAQLKAESSESRGGAWIRASGSIEARGLAGVREEMEEVGEEGLRRLQEEMKKLQTQFNDSAVRKHSLNLACTQLSERLKSATHLMESLQSRREAWQRRLDHSPSPSLLLTNCLLAAAVSTYCGPHHTLSRYELFAAMVVLCRETAMPKDTDASALLSLEQYPQFMIGQPALHRLTLQGLPPDPTSQQSACIITCGHAHSWPLISDPLGMALDWITHREKDTTVVEHQSPSLQSSLLTALTSGTHLVVTGVNGEGVCGDDVLVGVLQCREKLQQASKSCKMKIGDKEVECNPNFKLTLVTPSLPRALPCKLVAVTTVVLFWPEVGGIEGLLLDRMLSQQNAKIYQERQHLRDEMYKQCHKAEAAEKGLLELLSRDSQQQQQQQQKQQKQQQQQQKQQQKQQQDQQQLDGSRATRDLLHINASYEDAVESLNKTATALKTMTKVQLCSLSALASRAALISSVVMTTGSFLPLYGTSYRHVESVFLAFLEQASGHIQGDEAVERLTHFAYRHFSRGLLERDRFLFSFTLMLQIELARGHITHEAIRYIIYPSPGSKFAVKGLTAQAGMDLREATPVNYGKRPYDWVLEAQWQNMMMLMSRFAWAQVSIQEAFSDESKQAYLRGAMQSKHPELMIAAPVKKSEDDQFQKVEEHLQKRSVCHILMINDSGRPDRTFSGIQTLCEITLIPHKSSYDSPVDLPKFYKSCTNEGVPLIIFHDDPHLPTNRIGALTRKLHIPLTVYCVHGTGHGELQRVEQTLVRVSSEGGWLLVHNIQASPELLHRLPHLLKTHPPSDRWKLWLSVHAGSVTSLPVGMASLPVNRLVLDTPTSLKGSLLYSLHSLPPDVLSASTRPEWLPLLHSCCLLYAVLRVRQEIHTTSWISCLPLRHTHLTAVLGHLQRVIRQCEAGPGGLQPIPWSGIRYMLAEVFFGSSMCDPVDLCTLTSLVEAWIHPGGPRKEPGVYHTPVAFFTLGTKQAALCHAVASALPPLLITAEVCGLNTTPEIKMGRLESLLPALSSLTSLLDQHAPPGSIRGEDHTPLTRPLQPQGRAEDYARRHLLIPPGPILERLPSSVMVPHQIMELTLSGCPVHVLQDIGSSVSDLLNLPLESTVRRIQEMLPRGWKEDVLSEKLKRYEGSPSFHHFLVRETSQMSTSLHTIHSSLLSLLRALDPDSRGDPHTLTNTSHLSQLALSLLTLTVPKLWLDAIGPTAAPASWPLKEWTQDLALRWVFLDQVVTLGLAKVPTYWLGAFFNPGAFLSVIMQNVLDSQCTVSGASDEMFFLAEVTSRNKDHIRNPPPEGEIFVLGAYVWGCNLERMASAEFQDCSPKQSPTPLPLLHLALSTAQACKQAANEPAKGAEPKANVTYHCPAFVSHRSRRVEGGTEREVFRLLVHNPEVPPLRWAIRSISCTLRPF